jgi:DNA polymerase (family X)
MPQSFCMASGPKIAELLEEFATLLEFHGANAFKIRAFQGAAALVRDNAGNFEAFLTRARAGQVPGIGKQLIQVLETLSAGEGWKDLTELRNQSPGQLSQLLRVPGLGVRKVKALYSQLKVEDLAGLEAACRENRLATLKGFGTKTQSQILKGVQNVRSYQGHYLLPRARAVAGELVEFLKERKLDERVKLTGALRRCCEVLSTIDLLLPVSQEKKILEALRSANLVKEGASPGELFASHGIPLKVLTSDEETLEAANLTYTGSSEHLAQLRARATKLGFQLNTAGLSKQGKAVGVSEKDIYQALGLAFIPPELREGRGELEIAAANPQAFSDLVAPGDLKGVLHVHSTFSDGRNSLKEMAVAAERLGYQYLGICDHSKSAGYAGGLSIEKIQQQHREIEKLNEELAPFRIFKGIESDILVDGSLDYPDEVLESFDLVVASVHTYLTMTSQEMTGRILRAIRNPYTTMIGHISGRLLLEREAYAMDLPALMQAAATEGVAIELNANPLRLDLDWRYLAEAKALGLKIPICPDAHTVQALEDMNLGVDVARKGALTPEDIPNCWEASKIEMFFREARRRG